MKVSREVLEQIERHARQTLPAECCGILLGAGDDFRTVTRVLPAENAETADPARRYALDDQTHLRAVAFECARVARIVGYYHSHPEGVARPSALDRSQAVPGVVYLITAPTDGTAKHRAWRLEADEFVEEGLEIAG